MADDKKNIPEAAPPAEAPAPTVENAAVSEQPAPEPALTDAETVMLEHEGQASIRGKISLPFFSTLSFPFSMRWPNNIVDIRLWNKVIFFLRRHPKCKYRLVIIITYREIA